MTNLRIIIFLLCPILLFASGEKPVDDEKSSLPYSKQATIVDTSSPSEVVLESTGIYYSDFKSARARKKDIIKYGILEASIDAKKAAIYSLLFMGTDPILSTDEERDAFHSIEEAIAREKQFKSGSRQKKIDAINSKNPEWRDLFEDVSQW